MTDSTPLSRDQLAEMYLAQLPYTPYPLQEDALHHLVRRGALARSEAIHSDLAPYHPERPHQGLDHPGLAREGALGGQTGPVVRREHRGGLRRSSHREAA